MQQYLDLLKTIKDKGTYKIPAREGMPGTYSVFGHQMRFNLADGFPLLTTKKISFKNIVVELLWFLKGDTNIKYLVDNGCNIWNEDSYNFYLKQFGKNSNENYDIEPMNFEQFIDRIKKPQGESRVESFNYKIGDCGKQYGWLWRKWSTNKSIVIGHNGTHNEYGEVVIDQISDLINSLSNNPTSRRHIISAWNPATLDDMALNACHAFVQFNCRPLSLKERWEFMYERDENIVSMLPENFTHKDIDKWSRSVPKYYLDCQMYQRSADVFLGVPYNIASYALLTHILCKLTNMIPGDFVHTFGDVHIYENHIEQMNAQLGRTPKSLPELKCLERNDNGFLPDSLDKYFTNRYSLNDFFDSLEPSEFRIINYEPHPTIKAKLSTGLL